MTVALETAKIERWGGAYPAVNVGFVAGKELQTLLVCPYGVERESFIVHDNADAGVAGSQRNDPSPITCTHEVVGRPPSVVRPLVAVPSRIVRRGFDPFGDVDTTCYAKPACVGHVTSRLTQLELLAQERFPSRGVDDPACRQALRSSLDRCFRDRLRRHRGLRLEGGLRL